MENREIPDGVWYRTCQECGHKVICPRPKQDRASLDRYCEAKCPKCKSPGALDYGTAQYKENWDLEDLCSNCHKPHNRDGEFCSDECEKKYQEM